MENFISLRSKKAMTKEEYIVLTLSKWEQLEALKEQVHLYDYEKNFDELWVDLGRSVLEKSIGEVPKNRRKKKNSALDTEALRSQSSMLGVKGTVVIK
jgi:hypothetical protein